MVLAFKMKYKLENLHFFFNVSVEELLRVVTSSWISFYRGLDRAAPCFCAVAVFFFFFQFLFIVTIGIGTVRFY